MKFAELEDLLIAWFKKQRDSKLAVTQKMIIGQALKIFQQLKEKFEESGNEMLTKYQDSNFFASNGWFKKI